MWVECDLVYVIRGVMLLIDDDSSGVFFFFQAEDGIRDLVRSRGLGDVYKRQVMAIAQASAWVGKPLHRIVDSLRVDGRTVADHYLSLIHI